MGGGVCVCVCVGGGGGGGGQHMLTELPPMKQKVYSLLIHLKHASFYVLNQAGSILC